MLTNTLDGLHSSQTDGKTDTMTDVGTRLTCCICDVSLERIIDEGFHDEGRSSTRTIADELRQYLNGREIYFKTPCKPELEEESVIQGM